MNTSIVPITRAARSIKPPLRKSEIIEALAIRKKKQLDDEREAVQLKRDTLMAAAEKLARDSVSGAPPDADVCYGDYGWSARESRRKIRSVEVRVKITDRKVVAAYQRACDISVPRMADFAQIKRQVRDAVNAELSNPQERVAKLLNDPASARALDSMLKALDDKSEGSKIVPISA